jgi:hypothetical protein
LLGGMSIGAGVALLFVMTGRIGGISTVFSSTWSFVVQRPFFQQAEARRMEHREQEILGTLGYPDPYR